MSIRDINNTEHYNWGGVCDGWHLLKTDSLSIIQEKMPPNTEETFHYHTKAQQFFYILKGTATFETEKGTFTVHERQGFHIEPELKHHIMNKSSEDLEFLVISEPKSHGDRVNL
ncbi:cupin domain-containing protein [Elizabethkingia bruuniana]|uniref:Cupin domain-containing protein n=1 Tax=Elizabethkingia bruuniana TaxID=1756149 RepID=A0A7T7V0F6_9FLAO|nr:cupin domain-containing protein [Elizabethkingia bruuniana]KUY22949.1 cupin [Elizabethkingia bruuniana]QDZ61811.1 cupin domain-containing protein [Elizabethkingia bruuniana]QQN59541.1 cupin domain-containing protein [Elizabethkingia bruuniana]